MRSEDILHETIVLSEMETTAFGGDDARGVLTTMLEYCEAVDEHLVDVTIGVCE
jgi:hypothetical protein